MILAGLVAGTLAVLAAPAAADTVAADALMADVAALADDAMEGRRTASEGAARARVYIAGRFAGLGLEAAEQRFTFTSRGAEPREGVNLVVRIAGAPGAGRGHIVVTAHYDHDGIRDGEIYNGADDNASGVAALLAIAAALKASPPAHDVVLVALDAEEPVPGMFGARAYLAAPALPIGEILLNINLDMVSRGDGGELWAVGASHRPALRPVLEAVAADAPVPLSLGHDSGGGGEDWTLMSDHAPFHEAGIPFVYFGVEDHADYHRPTDDAARIDPGFFAGSVATILAALRAFDAEPERLAAARLEAAGEGGR